jgi:ABC-2 type transport system permease protein
MDKQETLDKFYTHYPQFKNYLLPDKIQLAWYYAMQQMGDDESAKESNDLESKLEQRNQSSQQITAIHRRSMHKCN